MKISDSNNQDTRIKCPYCAEKIQSDAMKCRYCGEWIIEIHNKKKDVKSVNPFLAFLIIIIASIGFTYFANAQLNPSKQKANISQPTQSITARSPVPTSIPTIKKTAPKVVSNPTTNPKPADKKVPVSISDPYLAGTYYCNESNANEVTRADIEVEQRRKVLDFCVSEYSAKIKGCDYSTGTCPTGDECNVYTPKIDEARNTLRDLIKKYCP